MMGVKWALLCPPGVAGESGERREESCGAATRKVWRLQPRFAPAPACQVTELGLSGRLRHLQAANTGRKFRELGITWFMVVWAPHWCQYPGHLYILYVGSESIKYGERDIHDLQIYKQGTILIGYNQTIRKHTFIDDLNQIFFIFAFLDAKVHLNPPQKREKYLPLSWFVEVYE